MEAAQPQPKFYLVFWLITGPLLIALSLCGVIAHGTTGMGYFPLVAFAALPIIYTWGTRGLVGSIGALLLSMLLFFHDLPPSERIFYLGIGTLCAMGLVVATLAFERLAESLSEEREALADVADVSLCETRMREEALEHALERVSDEVRYDEEVVRKLRNQLNTVRVAAFQRRLDHEIERRTLAQKDEQVHQVVGLYAQLQDQFEKTLWEREEEARQDKADDALITRLSHDLERAVARGDRWKTRSQELEELVSVLFDELKQRCVPNFADRLGGLS